MVPIATVTNDTDGALRQAGGRFGLTPEEAADALLLLVGSVEQMAETLIVRRERLGISYYVFFGQAMEPLAPVVARLAAFERVGWEVDYEWNDSAKLVRGKNQAWRTRRRRRMLLSKKSLGIGGGGHYSIRRLLLCSAGLSQALRRVRWRD